MASEGIRGGPITVIGATGQQGGAVIDALLEQRVPIRALTRNPNGDKARALATRGVEVVRADLEDVDSVRAAFDGAAAAFAMTTHDGPDGPTREVANGRVIAAAAADAALPFLVYSSVGGVDRDSGAAFRQQAPDRGSSAVGGAGDLCAADLLHGDAAADDPARRRWRHHRDAAGWRCCGTDDFGTRHRPGDGGSATEG